MSARGNLDFLQKSFIASTNEPFIFRFVNLSSLKTYFIAGDRTWDTPDESAFNEPHRFHHCLATPMLNFGTIFGILYT